MGKPERGQRVPRVTIDTNIFFRLFHRRDNPANLLLSLWRDSQFVLVLSQAILDEVREVLLRQHNMERYSYTEQEVNILINELTQGAIIVEVPCSYKLCRDPEDDRFIDCAIYGRAQFLLSYDNDLLDDSLRPALSRFGVETGRPHPFIRRIQE